MLNINELLFESRFKLILLGAFVFIGLLAAIDIVADIKEGTDKMHITIEFIVFIIAIFSAFAISLRFLDEANIARQVVNDMTLELQRNKEINRAMNRLNNRPRKCLGIKTPNQVFLGIKVQTH